MYSMVEIIVNLLCNRLKITFAYIFYFIISSFLSLSADYHVTVNRQNFFHPT